jgi:hypothetical protein
MVPAPSTATFCMRRGAAEDEAGAEAEDEDEAGDEDKFNLAVAGQAALPVSAA